MNWKTLLSSSALAVTAGIGLVACGQSSEVAAGPSEPAEAEPAQASEAAPADTSGLLARVSARWDAISHDDWIQAFDYQNPELKKVQKLSQFLQGKEDHQYRNPGKPRLVGVDGDLAYVDIEVVWTPLHAQIYSAQNLPPEGMTQVLRMVETWAFVDGEWFWHATERRNDFYRDHPQYAARTGQEKEVGEAEVARDSGQ